MHSEVVKSFMVIMAAAAAEVFFAQKLCDRDQNLLAIKMKAATVAKAV